MNRFDSEHLIIFMATANSICSCDGPWHEKSYSALISIKCDIPISAILISNTKIACANGRDFHFVAYLWKLRQIVSNASVGADV